MAFDLCAAPEVMDLQSMTCLPCGEDYFCGSGSRDGKGRILCVAPPANGKNADKDRLAGTLADDITHHVIRDLSGATFIR
jgi:hypothetical protein